MADQDTSPAAASDAGRAWRRATLALGVAVLTLLVVLLVVLVNDDEAVAPSGSAASTLPVATTAPARRTTAPPSAPTTVASPSTVATSTSPSTSVAATIPASAPSTSSTVAATTTDVVATTQPVIGELDTALWPAASAPVGYTDPVALVRDFAEQFVGMTDPDIGPYQAGDSRSGEIEVRAEPGAALMTTVFVRQLGANDLWWVLGAASANITVDTPRPLEAVASPLALSGTALAFEGTVAVTLWEDGAEQPAATTFVTGSGAPPAGPFTGELTFDGITEGAGSLLLTSASGEDGAVLEFAAFRIFFA